VQGEEPLRVVDLLFVGYYAAMTVEREETVSSK
jgi:hypothetical protein